MTTRYALQTPLVKPTAGYALGATAGAVQSYSAAARLDTCGTTSGSPVVTDAAIVAADAGRRVAGPGVPASTFVGTVTPGVSFRLTSSTASQVDVNATATAASVGLALDGASISPALPALSSVTDGDYVRVGKDSADRSPYPVVVTCAGSDAFDSGDATKALRTPGERLYLQAATINNVRVWKVVDHSVPPTFLDARQSGGYGAKAAAALQPFRAALADRASNPCNIVWLGDSTTEGNGISTSAVDRVKAAPEKLAQLLRYRFPTAGETQGVVAPNYVPVYTDSTLLTGWTVGSGWAKQLTKGLSATTAFSSTAGSTLTYTIPVGCTSLDVMHVAGTSLTGWTYTIDGGSASATQGTTGTNRDGATVRITGWDPTATHTLVITSIGNNNYIDGVMLYSGNESKGIRVFNAGHAGSRAEVYLQTSVYALAWTWINQTVPGPTLLDGVQSMIAANPDLLIIDLGYNDVNHNSSASYKTNVAAIVSAVRAMLPTKIIPVIYLDKWIPGSLWFSAITEPWTNYQAALASLAEADPWGMYASLSRVMPQPGTTLATGASLYADAGVHSNAKGYAMAADAMASLIAS